jgi:Uma2 family endonuclease
MAEGEVFAHETRVELVEGEVLERTPIGSRHAGCVNRLNRWLTSGVGDRAVVAVQNPIQVGDVSEPQPDLVLLRPRADFYAEHHALAPDVLLVVEVADTSLRFDLDRKTPLYVAAGIPEVWVVDLGGAVVVTRGGVVQELRPGDQLAPLAFPEVVVDVAELLG